MTNEMAAVDRDQELANYMNAEFDRKKRAERILVEKEVAKDIARMTDEMGTNVRRMYCVGRPTHSEVADLFEDFAKTIRREYGVEV